MKPKILLSFLVFLWFSSAGQEFNNSVSSSQFQIEDQSYPAFKTYFDYKPSDVEKGWWKYSRQFGKPLNMRKYYQVTIPREIEGVMVEIVLYSKPVTSGKGASFTLALDDQSIPSAKRNDYLAQLKLILMEFKRQFYLEKYEEQLVEVLKLVEKSSNAVDKTKGASRNKAFNELQVLNKEVDRIKFKIIDLQQ